jgi:predicted RNA binding protein YcfA (HicA-like mRNA interferase family)
MSQRLPSFKARELVALVKRAGFIVTHQDSSHLYFFHPVSRLTTCIPIHPGDVRRNLVLKILYKDCALTVQQVRNLLQGR